MLGRVICFFKGHRRGKEMTHPVEALGGRRYFACPRCGRVTSYKLRDSLAPAPAGSPAASTQEYLREQREKLR